MDSDGAMGGASWWTILGQAAFTWYDTSHASLGQFKSWQGLCRIPVPWNLLFSAPFNPISRNIIEISSTHKRVPAVWAAESKSRALHYSPPVKLNQVAIQCCLMIDARKVKASHFKTPDKQLMLREVWHGITYLYVCKASGTGAYRGTHPFGRFLPRFHWEQGFANWDALPAQWQVNTNTGPAASASTEGVPEIPRPSWTAFIQLMQIP